MSKKPKHSAEAARAARIAEAARAARIATTTPMPDGSTLVTFFATKRAVIIPSGIQVVDALPDTFAGDTRAAVDEVLGSRRHLPQYSFFFTPDHHPRMYGVLYRRAGHAVAVKVLDKDTEDDAPVLWALFRGSRTSWYERLAFASPHYRGKGIYTRVLKLLKRDLGVTIYSDRVLSALNDPKPAAAQVKTALRLAFVEAYTGDTLV